MPPKYDLRRIPKNDLSKFSTTEEPKKSKAMWHHRAIEVFQVKVRGRNASVNEANAYLDMTMKKLFEKYSKGTKNYQVTYKLSDGRWYSSKRIEDEYGSFYPDLHDEQYGISHESDLVEHINIAVF